MTPTCSPVIRSATSKAGRILLGSRGSARLGELLPLTPARLAAMDPIAKRKPRSKKVCVFGNVVRVLGKRKYMVHFDDQTDKEMISNTFKSRDQAASFLPDNVLLIAASREAAGSNIPASLEQLKQLASRAASGDTDALTEEEHLPKEIEIIEDLGIGEISNQGGRVDTGNDGKDDDTKSECVRWGDERAETFSLSSDSPDDLSDDDDDAVNMPSLVATTILITATATATTTTTTAAFTTTTATAAATATTVATPTTSTATIITPTKAAAAKPKEDRNVMVDGVSYKQRLSNSHAMLSMKVGEKMTIKQGKGINAKAIEWTVVCEHDPQLYHGKERTNVGIAGLDVESLRGY
jgi:hypothetical protein